MQEQAFQPILESDPGAEFFAAQAQSFPAGRGTWMLLICSLPVAIWLFLL